MTEKKITIVDYGMGNLYSVKNALRAIGIEANISDCPEQIKASDGIILPGVGAFPDAMDCLEKTGLRKTLEEIAGKRPLFGICLGMQLLFDSSSEVRECDGLGFIPGKVVHFYEDETFDRSLKVPHMGWNELIITENGKTAPILSGLDEESYVYFVHSYRAIPKNEADLLAYASYGGKVTALVGRDKIWGAQFHPEKSAAPGLKILKNFVDSI